MNNIKLFKRFGAFALCLVILCCSFCLPSFAASSDETTYALEGFPTTNGPWDSNSENVVLTFSNASAATTANFKLLFDYWDLAYQYNMTGGRRLLMVYMNSSYRFVLVFSDPSSDSLYSLVTSGSSNVFSFYNQNGTQVTSGAAIQDFQMTYGSWTPAYTSAYVTSTLTLSSGNYYAYRDSNAIINYKAVDGTSPPANLDNANAQLLANYNALSSYIDVLSGDGGGYQLDIGSIITAYLGSARTLFDGWFGFELFGINVAATLISILVIAIVVWIWKQLRGG